MLWVALHGPLFDGVYRYYDQVARRCTCLLEEIGWGKRLIGCRLRVGVRRRRRRTSRGLFGLIRRRAWRVSVTAVTTHDWQTKEPRVKVHSVLYQCWRKETRSVPRVFWPWQLCLLMTVKTELESRMGRTPAASAHLHIALA